MKEIVRSLVESCGPSGFEQTTRQLVHEAILPYVDSIDVDPLGNLIAVKKGTCENAKKIMFSAHTDEIGVVVTFIDEKGFLRFSNVGGLNPAVILSSRVQFANGVIGIIGQEKGDLKDLDLDKMYIDIGVDSKDEACKQVSIGDFAGFERNFVDLGHRWAAKSMDDRIGCAVLVQAIKRIKDNCQTLYFVFSAQEEVGLRGAQTAAYSINPDLGIAVDVTLTGDTPKAHRMSVCLGSGAAIKVKDSSLVAHPKVKGLLTELATENNIPYQLEVLERGGTDAGAIHLTRAGVPAGTISIPCRYVHTTSEMVDANDVQACVDLVTAVSQADLQRLQVAGLCL